MNVRNSIVAGNSAGGGGPNLFGTIANSNTNILGTTAGATITNESGSMLLGGLGLTVANVLNPTLSDNGGFTQTHALIPNSIAIDGTDDATATTSGQRALGRFGDRDIGAFELQPPEIEITGNGTVIADGDTTPSLSDRTDFGSIAVAASPITHTFTLQNLGETNLVLSPASANSPLVTLTGANAAPFALTTFPNSSVSNGSSATFQVTFTPETAGTYSATLSIANNDSNENPYDFVIQGTVTAAQTQGAPLPLSPPPTLPAPAPALPTPETTPAPPLPLCPCATLELPPLPT
ncbi:MAG: choice-of-anchor D domain-containing protein, partial [Cyanophyceae cyanobacterium]